MIWLLFQDIESVFQSVEKGEFQYGILPIENSIEGKVTSTLDALLEFGLHVYAEVHLPVNHQLISFSKSLQEVTTIYTHRQARFQCRKWLFKKFADGRVDRNQLYIKSGHAVGR